jgi:hypothetical protein
MVYISEAHAADVWNIGYSAGAINYSHKEINDRIDCSKGLIKEFNLNIPVYCDNMQDEFEKTFASWPTRYFVIKNNKILMIAEPEDSEINIENLFLFLDSMK